MLNQILVFVIDEHFVQNETDYLFLFILNRYHEWSSFILIFCYEWRNAELFQDIVDDDDMTTHTSPNKISIRDQCLKIFV